MDIKYDILSPYYTSYEVSSYKKSVDKKQEYNIKLAPNSERPNHVSPCMIVQDGFMNSKDAQDVCDNLNNAILPLFEEILDHYQEKYSTDKLKTFVIVVYELDDETVTWSLYPKKNDNNQYVTRGDNILVDDKEGCVLFVFDDIQLQEKLAFLGF